MLEGFEEYYSPSDEKYSDYLKRGIIVLDANVLLSPYRVDSDTRRQVFSLLDSLKERIWVPYHSAWEFFQNRAKVLGGEDKVYASLEKPLQDAKDKLDAHLVTLANHPVITTDVKVRLVRHLEDAISLVQRLNDGRDDKLEDALRSDSILQKWEVLLEGRIGPTPTDSQYATLEESAKERYRNSIPPGNLDESKKENKYGDAIIWLQLIDHLKDNPSPVLLITNDVKEDWYRRQNGRTIGPRVELVREIKKIAGVDYYQQRLDAFVSRASSAIHKPLSEKALEQVALTSKSRAFNFERYVLAHLQTAYPASEFETYLDSKTPGPNPDVKMSTPRGDILGIEIFDREGPLRSRDISQLIPLADNPSVDGLLVVTRGPISPIARDALDRMFKTRRVHASAVVLDEMASVSTLVDAVDEMIKRMHGGQWNKWGQLPS